MEQVEEKYNDEQSEKSDSTPKVSKKATPPRKSILGFLRSKSKTDKESNEAKSNDEDSEEDDEEIFIS